MKFNELLSLLEGARKIQDPYEDFKEIEDGMVRKNNFYVNGYSHKYLEAWVDENNFLHSPDNDTPAFITQDRDAPSQITYWFYKHGKIHRENDLPAEIVKKKDVVIREKYYFNNHLHRMTGPAKVYYNPDNYELPQRDRSRLRPGEIRAAYYYIHGVPYTEQDFKKYIEGLNKDEANMLGDLGQTFE